ncbi:MAG: nucleoside-triphosphatase [Candidatus Altiarchaeota archaeon]
MIILVLGDVGSGKTSICEKVLAKLEDKGFSCGGLLCPSVFEGGRKIASKAVDVASGGSVDFCSHKSQGVEGFEFCDWTFLEEGVRFGLKALEDGISRDVVFIDEVGPLELSGAGLAPALPRVFESGKHVIVVMKRHVKDRFYAAYPRVKAREYDVLDGDVVERIVGRIVDGA